MLDKFRKRYPEGSLVSELITIDHGKYVVKVLLQNNSVTLSTGLAADEKIETAEDRAIERALNSLKLDQKPVEISEQTIPQPSPPPQEIIQPQPQVFPPTPAQTVESIANKNEIKEKEIETKLPIENNIETTTKSSKKRVKATSSSKKSRSIEPEIEEKPLPVNTTPNELEIEEKPLPINTTPDELEIDEKPLPINTTSAEAEIEETFPPIAEIAEEIELEQKPAMEEEMLDFSEIIARSNVELKRLKWTTEQGRDYLIRTYGKRSRQVLSDEELLEFLRHLESLPTPS
ncbi:hypothetical protein [Crocosphaera sp. Alani8]|uniref:hypothetical protein n=1 Tax=Crocosphaera sp. Alani8 TaxID=3038952 RepID=UPI00313B77A9